METYLAPCPFCGEQSDVTFDYVELSCPQELGVMVVCKQCGAIGAQSKAGDIGAAEIWNSRPIENKLRKHMNEQWVVMSKEIVRLKKSEYDLVDRIAQLESHILELRDDLKEIDRDFREN